MIDLDETLVHSSFKPVPNADFIVPVEIDGQVHQVRYGFFVVSALDQRRHYDEETSFHQSKEQRKRAVSSVKGNTLWASPVSSQETSRSRLLRRNDDASLSTNHRVQLSIDFLLVDRVTTEYS